MRKNKEKKTETARPFKTIYIVDPIRSERIQLAKLIKQERFMIMAFVAIADCFKKSNQVECDLLIYAVRKGKSEPKHLYHHRKRYKNVPIVFLVNLDDGDVNLAEVKEQGFTSVHKAGDFDMVKEITHGLLLSEDDMQTESSLTETTPLQPQ